MLGFAVGIGIPFIVNTDFEIRNGGGFVVPAGTTITFSSKFSSTDYSVFVRCFDMFDMEGDNTDFILTEKTVFGFKITPIVNSTIEYIAVRYVEGIRSRVGTGSVVTTGTVITFKELFSSAYKVIIRCFDAGGNNVDFLFTDKTTTGFKITPTVNSTIEFIAIIGEAKNIRLGNQSVTTAGTIISFSSDLSLINYTVGVRCFDGSGDNISFKLANKTKNGFTVTPVINSTIEYIAILSTESFLDFWVTTPVNPEPRTYCIE